MIKKYPALSWTTIAGVVSGLIAAWESANSTGATNLWLLAIAAVPIIAGALTHASVVPVDSVRTVIARARTASAAVTELANKVDVAVGDRPGS